MLVSVSTESLGRVKRCSGLASAELETGKTRVGLAADLLMLPMTLGREVGL